MGYTCTQTFNVETAKVIIKRCQAREDYEAPSDVWDIQKVPSITKDANTKTKVHKHRYQISVSNGKNIGIK